MISVKPWDVRESGGPYDLFIGTLGYERRARFLGRRFGLAARKRAVAGFQSGQELSYEPNRAWFSRRGFQIDEPAESEFEDWVRLKLSGLDPQPTGVRICIDCSSATRRRLAFLFSVLTDYLQHEPAEVHFLYSFSRFTAPPNTECPIIDAGPIIPRLAGWTRSPEKPVSVIIGLGYEQTRAMGALEYIEPSGVWLFVPCGGDRRFDKAIIERNDALLTAPGSPQALTYNVTDPFETLIRLESLMYGASQKSRLVVLPFGPKVFALAAIAAAVLHHKEAAVWRVSSGTFEPKVDRAASGRIVGLSLESLSVRRVSTQPILEPKLQRPRRPHPRTSTRFALHHG